jgi:transcriptional regulator with XRE-family HTH domain
MTNASTVSREAVAAEVRAWMGRRRVSQTALAKQLGISQAAISRRLNSEVPFDLDELFAMADYFGVAPSDLLSAGTNNVRDLRSRPLTWKAYPNLKAA